MVAGQAKADEMIGCDDGIARTDFPATHLVCDPLHQRPAVKTEHRPLAQRQNQRLVESPQHPLDRLAVGKLNHQHRPFALGNVIHHGSEEIVF
jgi:hypothetical protein